MLILASCSGQTKTNREVALRRYRVFYNTNSINYLRRSAQSTSISCILSSPLHSKTQSNTFLDTTYLNNKQRLLDRFLPSYLTSHSTTLPELVEMSGVILTDRVLVLAAVALGLPSLDLQHKKQYDLQHPTRHYPH